MVHQKEKKIINFCVESEFVEGFAENRLEEGERRLEEGDLLWISRKETPT